MWYYIDVGKETTFKHHQKTNIMVTAENILYSVSSTRRILGISCPETKVRIQVWKKVVWVHIQGSSPTFISKSVFKTHFVEWRQSQSKSIAVARHAQSEKAMAAFNPAKGTSYVVQPLPCELICGCEDFWNQVKFFGTGCCKHGYAVLNHLGYKSLAQYIADNHAQIAA